MTDLESDIANYLITAWPMFTPKCKRNRSLSRFNKEDIVFLSDFSHFPL